MFADPFVLVIQNDAYSVDDDSCVLKHTIRDSYRQFYLAKASQRRQDCSGQKQPIDVANTRAFYLSLPIHQSIMRHILTGSLDHTYRLYMSNLVSSPICPHCNVCDETAEHIFWYCSRWDSIRHEYSTLLRLFSLVGTQWPKCFLHCGWIELFCDYGISFLFDLGITYSVQNLVHDTHRMFLKIILARHTASQVLRSTPLTPPNHPTPPSSPHTILSSPSSCVQLPGDVSPLSLMYSPGSYNPLSPSFESQKNIYLKYVDTKHIFGKAWKNL